MHPFRRVSKNPRSNIVRIGNRDAMKTSAALAKKTGQETLIYGRRTKSGRHTKVWRLSASTLLSWNRATCFFSQGAEMAAANKLPTVYGYKSKNAVERIITRGLNSGFWTDLYHRSMSATGGPHQRPARMRLCLFRPATYSFGVRAASASMAGLPSQRPQRP
jgi:hypothetical protein